MKILILGAGAIGSVFGGFLAKSGHEVVLLGRQAHMATINQNGLKIEGIWGEHDITSHIKGYTLLSAIREGEGDTFELILLTVKSYDTKAVIRDYLQYFLNNAPMVSLQNGLGNLEKIVELLGSDRAIGGRVIFGAEIIESGRVKVTVYADAVVVGGVSGGIDPRMVEKIAAIFSQSGIPSHATNEIEKYIWGKVLYNSALNALGSILEVNYGELLNREETRKIIVYIIYEIFSVIEKSKTRLFWNTPDEYLKLLFDELIPATYNHFPSMLQDIRRKRMTEIESINGAVVKTGEDLGLFLPVNKVTLNLVKVKERIARSDAR